MNNMKSKMVPGTSEVKISETKIDSSKSSPEGEPGNSIIHQKKEKYKMEEEQKNEQQEKFPESSNSESDNEMVQDSDNIFVWLENANLKPRQLSDKLEEIDGRLDTISSVLDQCKVQLKKLSGVDKRVETLDSQQTELKPTEKKLLELQIIKLETEKVNLREKRDQVNTKFIQVCGTEKKSLQYKQLRDKAKSGLYHKRSGYFIKQKILQLLNEIIGIDKSALTQAKTYADDKSSNAEKIFNEYMRELLEKYDEYLLILCSHHKRDEYFKIIRYTLTLWKPKNGNIDELGDISETKVK